MIDGKIYTPKPLLPQLMPEPPAAPGYRTAPPGASSSVDVPSGPTSSSGQGSALLGEQAEGVSETPHGESPARVVPTQGGVIEESGSVANDSIGFGGDTEEEPEAAPLRADVDPDTPVVLRLEETPTAILFSVRGTCVSKVRTRSRLIPV